MAYKKINNKLSWDFVNKKSPYIRCKMYNRHKELIEVDYNAYIFGLVGMQKFKKQNEDHSIVLIDGLPGSGKSTFIEGISALDSAFMDETMTINDIAWSMDNLISLMDSTENQKRPVWADEFIQGTSRFNQSSIGIKLKIGFVTKRLKRNTYFLVVDEIKEFPEKLIKMVDAYIHVKKIGFNRGYYDCWTNKDKIYKLWDNFKNYSNNWGSPWIKRIKPDNKGKFMKYRGLFLDVDEFDKRKFEETAQGEKKDDKKFTAAAVKAYSLKIKNPEKSFRQIALEIDMSPQFVSDSYKKIDKLATST